MINVGILGFGKMGQLRAQTLEDSGLGKVKKIFDVNSNQDSNYDIALSPEEIFTNKKIDAVFICTPNYLNKPLTIQGLKAGKHVFCEKPPAFNEVEVVEIIETEKASGKKLMYGFNHRHHESIKMMKDLVDKETYGKILWMRGRYGKSVDKNFFSNWRANSEKAGGGILLDQGIHMLDLFTYLGGEFDEVKAMISNLYWDSEIEDNVFAILRNNQTGVVASLHSTMTQWRHLFSLEVFLEHGYFVLNGLKTSSGTYGEEILNIAKNRSEAPRATWKDEKKYSFDSNVSWQSEVEHFLDAIIKDNPITIGNSNDAQIIMRIVDKIYKDGLLAIGKENKDD
jgi:1,5-anhydro-D-fructose reductase (1,5-anhydro-D-mannitol-forming)